jgi:hypothetical protein
MQLERERRANHLGLIGRRDVAVLHPLLPVAHGLAQEALAQLRERLFDRRAPGEREVLATGERERLPVQVRERYVRSEPHGVVVALERDVIGALNRARRLLGPPENRVALNTYLRGAGDRLDDAHELRGPEHPAVLHEARREIDHPERAAIAHECGLEHVRVLEVALRPERAVHGAHRERAALGVIEQRTKHGLRIEPGQTAPHDCPGTFD